MIEHWFRWHHGTVTDPKWKVIARRASEAMSRHVTPSHATAHKVTPATVIAVWAAMLECASQASPRGTLDGWSDEDVAAAYDLDEIEVRCIREAMQDKTLDGNALKAWEKRQPKRERDDPKATERKRAQRERDVVAGERVTPCHAMSRHVTPRGEERREEEKEQSQYSESNSLASGEGNTPRAGASARDDGDIGDEPSQPAIATDSPGTIAKALRAAGVLANPQHPRLLALLAAGARLEEFTATAAELIAANGARGPPKFPYLLATIEGRRRDAANESALPGNRHAIRPRSRESLVERAERELDEADAREIPTSH